MGLAARRLKVIWELLAWIKNNLGVAVLIGGPGDRGESGHLVSHERPNEGHVVYRVSSRRCVEAALVNGTERVFGPIEAMEFELKLFLAGGWSRKSITNLRRMLHACNKGVDSWLEVRKISAGDKPSFRSTAFRWLAEEVKGVWVVRLVESGVADHCVFVDTKVALILDCAARHPISLTEEALRFCSGDDTRKVRLFPQKASMPKRVSKRARIE